MSLYEYIVGLSAETHVYCYIYKKNHAEIGTRIQLKIYHFNKIKYIIIKYTSIAVVYSTINCSRNLPFSRATSMVMFN